MTTQCNPSRSSDWPLAQLNLWQAPLASTLLERQRGLTWFALLMLLGAIAAMAAAMFAMAAVALTATQGLLAWAIWRHAPVAPLPVAAQAVLLGLMLTWVLGAASGFLLGAKQPPAYGDGALPWLGWHWAGGDGRPAHFLALHAHQLLPLLGFVLQRYLPCAAGVAVLWVGAAAYLGTWWWLMHLAIR